MSPSGGRAPFKEMYLWGNHQSPGDKVMGKLPPPQGSKSTIMNKVSLLNLAHGCSKVGASSPWRPDVRSEFGNRGPAAVRRGRRLSTVVDPAASLQFASSLFCHLGAYPSESPQPVPVCRLSRLFGLKSGHRDLAESRSGKKHHTMQGLEALRAVHC